MSNQAGLQYQYFKLTVPPSVNKVWLRGKHGSYMAPKYRKWLDQNSKYIEVEREFKEYVHVAIDIHGGKGWRMNRDIDNIFKAVMDLLVKCKVITDDCTKVVVKVAASYLPPSKRTELAYLKVCVEGIV